MPTSITFTTLLDWVDGRLEADRTAAVAAHVAETPEAAETVEWIRSFREAGTSMPLEAPPADLSAELRAAFRRHTAVPPGTGAVGELSGDTRPFRIAAGARATAGEGVGHVVLEGDGTTLTLSVLNRRPDVVDLHGHVAWTGTGQRPEIVITAPDPTSRRVARPEANGEFRLTDVARGVDEVWVVSPAASLHARLDLRSDL